MKKTGLTIYRILAFLDLKQAIQTSVLSTKWRYVWTSLPFLNFNIKLFPGTTKHRFDAFVYKVLALRDAFSSIRRLRLSCNCFNKEFDVDIYPCVLIALKHNVEELYIDSKVTHTCQLPICQLFTCKSLTILELELMGYWLSVPDSMSLPSLKTLNLFGIRFEDDNDDDILNKILLSCPVLESLALSYCVFYQTHVNISDSKLKHLVLEGFWDYHIELDVPNLVSFSWDDSIKLDSDCGNLLDKREAQIPTMNFMRAVHNVEALRLTRNWKFLEAVAGDLALLERSLPIQFRNLKCLELSLGLSEDTINAMTYLFKISPNIESLCLQMQNEGVDHQALPHCNGVNFLLLQLKNLYQEQSTSLQGLLHHLKCFQIRGFEGRINEIMFVQDLLKAAMVLEKLVVHCFLCGLPTDEHWLSKLENHLVRLPRASQGLQFIRCSIEFYTRMV